MLSNEAKAKRNAYQRDYYRRNRETLLANQREWRKNNPDKVQEYINQNKPLPKQLGRLEEAEHPR